MDAADIRGLCGMYWFRVVAVCLGAGIVVTVMLVTFASFPALVTLQHSLVHAVSTGALGGAILPPLRRRLKTRSFAVQWGSLLPTLLGLAVGGAAIACSIMTVTGLGYVRHFHECFAYDFRINALITCVIGVAMTLFEAQRAQLAAITLELRTKQLDHERASTMALEAQLSSLESRLQPHFLFNTLNAISALIHEDPERAERTVERLAALLRFSLDATQRGMIPLAHEVQIVTDYLEIEKARLGDRLSYTIDADRDATAVEIPPLALQTLVENSIKHAIAPTPSGGCVRVTTSLNGERATLSVWDDGPGFTTAAMLPGHGLDNLRSRLAARFGSAAVLDIGRRDGGTLVTISVPRNTPEAP